MIVVGTCVWGRQYQVRSVEHMIGFLNQIETADDDETAYYIGVLYDAFVDTADVLACYMNHDDVDAAKEAIVHLRSAVHHFEKQEILSAAEEVRAQLEKLRNIDAIRLENVL